MYHRSDVFFFFLERSFTDFVHWNVLKVRSCGLFVLFGFFLLFLVWCRTSSLAFLICSLLVEIS